MRLTASVIGRVAGLAAIAFLHACWLRQPGPLALKGLAAVIVVVSIARPASGLLVFAGLAPLSTSLAGLLGGGMGAQLLEQIALGVGAGTLLRRGAAGGRTRIGGPGMLLAAVGIASAASMAPAALAPVARGLGDAGLLLDALVDRQGAQATGLWTPIFAALTVVECALLGWSAERLVRQSPRLAMQLVRLGLIGHAGAAVLSLSLVLRAALSSGDALAALPGLFMSLRLSMQTDVHAAASALVLAGVAGIGLMGGPRVRRGRALVILCLVLVAAGLWITGSRVAIVLGAMATVAATGWAAVRVTRYWRFVVVGAALLALASGLWLAMRYSASRYSTFSASINARLVMYKVGVRMFERAPGFGIGISRFYSESAFFIGPAEAGIIAYARENAHNNFIQVMAEQGLVGLGALLWWLGVVVIGGVRAQISNPDAGRRALLVAIVASIGTWLTGHPLLVPEFAFVFWLYFGILAAMTPASPAGWPRWILGVLMAILLVSVVPRADALRNAADLEHRAFGLSSLWQHDDEQRYREAGATFAIFLPASGRPVELPVRRAPGAPDPLVVDVSIRGRIVSTITIAGEAWQTALVQMPQQSRRFELVDFTVRLPPSASGESRVLLRVGRDR